MTSSNITLTLPSHAWHIFRKSHQRIFRYSYFSNDNNQKCVPGGKTLPPYTLWVLKNSRYHHTIVDICIKELYFLLLHFVQLENKFEELNRGEFWINSYAFLWNWQISAQRPNQQTSESLNSTRTSAQLSSLLTSPPHREFHISIFQFNWM